MAQSHAPGGPIRFTLEPVTAIPPIEALWRRLDAAGNHSFFASWTWIGTWLQKIPWDFTPLLLRAQKDGETIAAAFLIPRREKRGMGPVRQLHFNSTGEDDFDCVTIEYTGFAGPGTADPLLWPAFMEWFTGYADADELIVPGVTGGHVAEMATNPGLLGSTRNVAAFRVCELSSIVETGIEARLSRNSRQQLRRSMRHYLSDGALQISEADTIDTAQTYFTELMRLHIRSWTERGRHHAFRHPFFEKFHRALIVSGIDDRTVQLLRITAGERVIGYLYNFRLGERIYAYQSGFDDSEKGSRPGYVCHALAIGLNANQGAEVYDFLAGNNRLKKSFADSRYVMSWCTYRHRSLRFQAERLAWSAASRIAALKPSPPAAKLSQAS